VTKGSLELNYEWKEGEKGKKGSLSHKKGIMKPGLLHPEREKGGTTLLIKGRRYNVPVQREGGRESLPSKGEKKGHLLSSGERRKKRGGGPGVKEKRKEGLWSDHGGEGCLFLRGGRKIILGISRWREEREVLSTKKGGNGSSTNKKERNEFTLQSSASALLREEKKTSFIGGQH